MNARVDHLLDEALALRACELFKQAAPTRFAGGTRPLGMIEMIALRSFYEVEFEASRMLCGEFEKFTNSHATVALAAHEDQASAGFGREPEDGDPAWRQQKELLAHGENPGGATGTVCPTRG